jgi:hypothetical protein
MIDSVFINSATVWTYLEGKTAVAQWTFTAIVNINVTFDETVEDGTVSFLKLVDETNNNVWMFALLDDASYSITLYDISTLNTIFINTTNHTTTSNYSGTGSFTVSQSGTVTTLNVFVTREKYGYIYDTKFVQ